MPKCMNHWYLRTEVVPSYLLAVLCFQCWQELGKRWLITLSFSNRVLNLWLAYLPVDKNIIFNNWSILAVFPVQKYKGKKFLCIMIAIPFPDSNCQEMYVQTVKEEQNLVPLRLTPELPFAPHPNLPQITHGSTLHHLTCSNFVWLFAWAIPKSTTVSHLFQWHSGTYSLRPGNTSTGSAL